MSSVKNEKIYFISLGCDKNRVDAEKMCFLLENAGYGITSDLEEADAAIINTCGFIESAKTEALDNIFDMVNAKIEGVIKAVIVTGCLSERHGEEMMEIIPEVDAVVGIGQNSEIVDIVGKALHGTDNEYRRSPLDLPLEGDRLISTPQHYAFLKIAEGCDNHCTFCAIPGIRGKYRSRKPESILEEAHKLVSYGVREIILVAQDTTSYGKDLDEKVSLASLLRDMSAIEGLWKIRILYAYPEHITDELLSEMASNSRVCKYLDIPLQHADDLVLRRMGRFGSGKENLELIKKIKKTVPGITLRSTFIVGFPGETDEQFDSLISFLRDAQIDRAGCFTYSAEEGTAAEKMKDQLPEELKKERAEIFYDIQQEITQRLQENKVGSVTDVICDFFDEDRASFICRSESDAPEDDLMVVVPLKYDLIPGEIYKVRITGTDGLDLAAEPID
ncbi:MAG: 30S ribosomal protein S12 methylthiotransferase RimO [Oscillospiraceae bacterium]|nr:30S ribosomal protein S12 methylthiotransferase RimO [Oscillospiraceae bacterium]